MGHIEAIADGFIELTGPSRDQRIAEAEQMLAEIKARNFTPVHDAAEKELTAAKDRKYLYFSHIIVTKIRLLLFFVYDLA